jgi:hypothetical protein
MDRLQDFRCKTSKDLGVDGITTLKCVFKEYGLRVWIGSSSTRFEVFTTVKIGCTSKINMEAV